MINNWITDGRGGLIVVVEIKVVVNTSVVGTVEETVMGVVKIVVVVGIKVQFGFFELIYEFGSWLHLHEKVPSKLLHCEFAGHMLVSTHSLISLQVLFS